MKKIPLEIKDFGRNSFVTHTTGLKERLAEKEKQMSREIKFRGKRTSDNKWVYGYFLINPNGACIYDPEIGDMPVGLQTKICDEGQIEVGLEDNRYTEIEVIGNRWENPELLEQGNGK